MAVLCMMVQLVNAQTPTPSPTPLPTPSPTAPTQSPTTSPTQAPTARHYYFNNSNPSAFNNTYLKISPIKTRVPLEVTIGFSINTNASFWEGIFIRLPQFTSGDCNGKKGKSIGLGSVLLSPSLYFIGEWQEGGFDPKSNKPFYNSTLVLFFKELMQANATAIGSFEVKLYKENGLKAYCGWSENWDQFQISTNTTGFGANATHTSRLTVEQLGAGCSDIMHNCSGHGYCDFCFDRCTCMSGWGAPDDVVADYILGDCSARTCPVGRSIVSVPTGTYTGHDFQECSNNGVCDRATGTCRCFRGFKGDACQRQLCPNQCSGHGRCLGMNELAVAADAFPLSNNTRYGTLDGVDSRAWDGEAFSGCVCDSAWPVGLGSGQYQTAEWFGADCSLRRCPGGDDPETDWDETDCSGKLAAGGYGTGAQGNKCHLDCSGRGLCDYTTGICKCFDMYYGDNCSKRHPIKYLSYAVDYS